MALPANVDLVTVTGTYIYVDGTPATGEVTFTPSLSSWIQDAGAPATLLPRTITATLDIAGKISVPLPATDDPDLAPNGWTYDVVENFGNGLIRKYAIGVPTSPGTIDLATVAPVTPVSGGSKVVTKVNGKVPDINGAVVLTPSDIGALPATYTPPAAPVQSVSGKTGIVLLSASDVGALPVDYPVVLSVNGKTGSNISIGAAEIGALDQVTADAKYAQLTSLAAAKGDGTTDDTAAINTILAAVPAGSVVRGVPGRNYLISAPLVLRAGGQQTLDMTGCTVTLKAGSNCNMLQNAAVAATGTRDSKIAVIGGTWARVANGGVGTANHSLMFRRCDGLEIQDVEVTSTAGKYAICVGDVTDVVAERLTFATASDGVHINGPARRVTVRTVRGSTGDDSVAITANDYVDYADVVGDVIDVVITDVATTAEQNVVKVLSGATTTARGIKVSDISGTSTAGKIVYIGEDPSGANTTGGSIGAVNVARVSGVPAAGHPSVYIRVPAGGIRALHVRDVEFTAQTASVPAVRIDGTGTLRHLLLDGLAVLGNLAQLCAVQFAEATVDLLTVQALAVPDSPTAANLIIVSGGTLRALDLTSCQVVMGDTSSNVIDMRGTATVGRIHVSDGTYSSIRCLLNTASTNPATTLAIHGGYYRSPNRLANLQSPAEVDLSGVHVETPVNPLFHLAHANATLRLKGGPIRQTSGLLLSRSATQTITVQGLLIPADVALLAKQAGDMAYNTNAALSCGDGPVVCDGTTWKHLHSGLTY